MHFVSFGHAGPCPKFGSQTQWLKVLEGHFFLLVTMDDCMIALICIIRRKLPLRDLRQGLKRKNFFV